MISHLKTLIKTLDPDSKFGSESRRPLNPDPVMDPKHWLIQKKNKVFNVDVTYELKFKICLWYLPTVFVKKVAKQICK